MANLPAPLTSSTKTVLARIDALVAAGAPTLDAVADAVQRADYDEAVELALARSFAGEELPIEVVVTILPGTDKMATQLALIKASTGPRSKALVELVRSDRLPKGEIGRDIAALLLYVSWQLRDDGDLRERIAWPVRRFLRHRPGPRGVALLVWLANQLNDKNVTSVAEDVLPNLLLHHGGVLELAESVDQLLAEPVRELVKHIPMPESRSRMRVGLPLRAATKPGRNDMCPCMSGKKYKRCCQDKDDSAFSLSPAPGLSWDEYLMQAADTMTAQTVCCLSLRDLAMVDLRKLGRAPLVAAFRRFTSWRRWDLAERALERILEHPDRVEEDADDLRIRLIAELAVHGEWTRARLHADKVRDKDALPRDHMVALALAEAGPSAFQRLTDMALQVLHEADQDEAADLDLAYALLNNAPALGILVARGCLTAERQFDSEFLLEQVEKARDRLNLPPGDPAWETWSALSMERESAEDNEEDTSALNTLTGQRGSPGPLGAAVAGAPAETTSDGASSEDSTHARLAEEIRALQAALRESSTRAGDLEQQLKVQEANAAAAVSAPPKLSHEDPGAVRRLQAKVSELKTLIDAGNEERRDLRRKLATASGTRSSSDERTLRAPRHVADDNDGLPIEMHVRGVLVPRVLRRAEDALHTVAAHVAAEAMRTLGSLSAGERAAWRNVKQAKDMGFPLLMARVGIHHRLLFRVDEGVLEVVDLVSRENLDTTLKRLRAT